MKDGRFRNVTKIGGHAKSIIQIFIVQEYSTVYSIDYRCEDRKKVGELGGDISAIR
jgi:hypothetical protein